MRIFASLSIMTLFACGLFGQHGGARGGGSHGGFHGGGGYHLGGSGLVGGGARVGIGGGYVASPYVYPIYAGSGYYYPPDYTAAYTDGTYAPAPQPNVTVVYPPQQSGPPMVNQFGPGYAPPPGANPEPVSPYEPSTAQDSDQSQPDHYLIALKDHTVYSVVAYWVEGDTLHYFTAGNIHNQASLSLVDRDLTARLNKESGTVVNIPSAK